MSQLSHTLDDIKPSSSLRTPKNIHELTRGVFFNVCVCVSVITKPNTQQNNPEAEEKDKEGKERQRKGEEMHREVVVL